MGNALDYLGIARKAGLLAIGEEAAGFAVRGGKARLLLLAGDASPNARRRAEAYTRGTRIPLVYMSSAKSEIAARVGKHGCSMIAVTDFGLAAEILKSLAHQDSGRYGEAAQAMCLRSEKAARRRKEARAKDDGKTLGKRRK